MIDRQLLLESLRRVPDPTSVIRFVDELLRAFDSLGNSIESSVYRFDPATAAADPGSGQIRFNSATPGSVTAVYVNTLNQNGSGISAALMLLKTGDTLIVQDNGNPDNAIRFTIPATLPVDNTGWWTVAVTHVSDQGSLPNPNSLLSVIFYF